MIFGYLSIGILIFQQIFLNYFYMKVSFVIFPPYNLLLVLCFVSLIRTFSDMQTSFYALRLSSLFPLVLAFIASVVDIYYFCLLCIPVSSGDEAFQFGIKLCIFWKWPFNSTVWKGQTWIQTSQLQDLIVLPSVIGLERAMWPKLNQ